MVELGLGGNGTVGQLEAYQTRDSRPESRWKEKEVFLSRQLRILDWEKMKEGWHFILLCPVWRLHGRLLVVLSKVNLHQHQGHRPAESISEEKHVNIDVLV